MRTGVVENGESKGRQYEADQSPYDLCQERGPEDDRQTLYKRGAREVGLSGLYLGLLTPQRPNAKATATPPTSTCSSFLGNPKKEAKKKAKY